MFGIGPTCCGYAHRVAEGEVALAQALALVEEVVLVPDVEHRCSGSACRSCTRGTRSDGVILAAALLRFALLCLYAPDLIDHDGAEALEESSSAA
jgi:hypothetical protein